MIHHLPDIALSVRQPWAFTLAAGWKPVENRSWRRPNPGLRFRGDFAIHASTGMTQDEYRDCAELCRQLGFDCPAPADLDRGGIVGVATIVDVVREFDSQWFFGPVGLIIANARPVDFVAVGGRLGFFEWKKLLPICKTTEPAPPEAMDAAKDASRNPDAPAEPVHMTDAQKRRRAAAYRRGHEDARATDAVVEAVREDLRRRSEIGIAKYGVTLERTDLTLRDWLQHAYEETLDKANYLKRAILEIEANG